MQHNDVIQSIYIRIYVWKSVYEMCNSQTKYTFWRSETNNHHPYSIAKTHEKRHKKIKIVLIKTTVCRSAPIVYLLCTRKMELLLLFFPCLFLFIQYSKSCRSVNTRIFSLWIHFFWVDSVSRLCCSCS